MRPPVQFVEGIETLYAAGARIFIEAGPKRALSGLTADILGTRPYCAVYSAHPKKEEVMCFNELLAALYAQGLGRVVDTATSNIQGDVMSTNSEYTPNKKYEDLGRAVGRFLEQMQSFQNGPAPRQNLVEDPLVVSGISLGLPGKQRDLFAESNFDDILAGHNFIESLSLEDRQRMAIKHITRLVKRNNSDPTLETLYSMEDMVHLAGFSGRFNLEEEFGVLPELRDSMNRSTQMAVAAGILALQDAGIPLVLHQRQTAGGKTFPTHWALPQELGDQTGVVFASAFGGKRQSCC